MSHPKSSPEGTQVSRRHFLKSSAIAGSAALILPACNFSPEKAGLALTNLQVTPDQQTLMEAVVNALIPPGEIKGALELGVHNFIWIIIDECRPTEEQNAFLAGIDQMDALVRHINRRPFHRLSPALEADFLDSLEAGEITHGQIRDSVENPFDLEAIRATYREIKRLTIRGYYYSEYIMTEVMPYQLVPGAYDFCHPIDPNARVNIHA